MPLDKPVVTHLPIWIQFPNFPLDLLARQIGVPLAEQHYVPKEQQAGAKGKRYVESEAEVSSGEGFLDVALGEYSSSCSIPVVDAKGIVFGAVGSGDLNVVSQMKLDTPRGFRKESVHQLVLLPIEDDEETRVGGKSYSCLSLGTRRRIQRK
ncbi:hypothetical protein LIER_15963 [Lithospermum erythrorhizon]|uniref:DUF4283 domain-containing protein n=1 Tax=Lithospermum erythrorhizon TaxID=34254 RepID=A0AAV3Q6A9_LITER